MLKSKSISEFFPAPFLVLRPNEEVPFDIYLYFLTSDHILLWRAKGEIITADLIQRYGSRGLEKIWIHKSDTEVFEAYKSGSKIAAISIPDETPAAAVSALPPPSESKGAPSQAKADPNVNAVETTSPSPEEIEAKNRISPDKDEAKEDLVSEGTPESESKRLIQAGELQDDKVSKLKADQAKNLDHGVQSGEEAATREAITADSATSDPDTKESAPEVSLEPGDAESTAEEKSSESQDTAAPPPKKKTKPTLNSAESEPTEKKKFGNRNRKSSLLEEDAEAEATSEKEPKKDPATKKTFGERDPKKKKKDNPLGAPEEAEEHSERLQGRGAKGKAVKQGTPGLEPSEPEETESEELVSAEKRAEPKAKPKAKQKLEQRSESEPEEKKTARRKNSSVPEETETAEKNKSLRKRKESIFDDEDSLLKEMIPEAAPTVDAPTSKKTDKKRVKIDSDTLVERLANEDLPKEKRDEAATQGAEGILAGAGQAETSKGQSLLNRKARETVRDLLKTSAADNPMIEELFGMADQIPELEHSVDVATYSVVFAMLAGISEPQTLADLAVAGLVHDIGHCFSPPRVQQVPWNELNEYDAETYKTHVMAGLKWLAAFAPEVTPAQAALIQRHHEKFDGTGYPRGEKGFSSVPASEFLAMSDLVVSIASGRWDGTKRHFRGSFEFLVALEKNHKSQQFFNRELFSKVMTSFKDAKMGEVLESAQGIAESQKSKILKDVA